MLISQGEESSNVQANSRLRLLICSSKRMLVFLFIKRPKSSSCSDVVWLVDVSRVQKSKDGCLPFCRSPY